MCNFALSTKLWRSRSVQNYTRIHRSRKKMCAMKIWSDFSLSQCGEVFTLITIKVCDGITYQFENFTIDPGLYCVCDYLSMLGIKLIRASKRDGPGVMVWSWRTIALIFCNYLDGKNMFISSLWSPRRRKYSEKGTNKSANNNHEHTYSNNSIRSAGTPCKPKFSTEPWYKRREAKYLSIIGFRFIFSSIIS